jgi:uncharacterized protein (DUF1501 family)
MLTLLTGSQSRDCQGISRRDFVRAGVLGLGGLTLAQLLAARAGAAGQGFVRNRSVVLLFLSGGASHIETFDPNMDAPAPYRSVNGEVQTSVPGVTFGATFPKLATQAHRMAVVRSYRHPIGDHVKAIQHVLTGGNPTGASIGSIYTRLRGTNHPDNGLPTYALVTTPEVDPQYRNEQGRVVNGSGPGPLGAACTPFQPDGKGPAMRDLELHIAGRRLDDRRALLRSLDRIDRHVDTSGMMSGLDKFEQQAFDLILGGAKDAFDLSKEDPRVVARYDTGQYRVGKKTFRPCTIGKQMLMARRLCEAGCGFVTVHSAGWDMHADGNNPGIVEGMNMLGRPLDHAVATFLDDIHERGLGEQILLVITGDFGRTPKINARGGRDHWSNLCTLALAGGGLRMGQVIGQSTRQADAPASEPVATDNLMASILHCLLDVGTLRLKSGVPRELMALVENAPPIPGLF